MASVFCLERICEDFERCSVQNAKHQHYCDESTRIKKGTGKKEFEPVLFGKFQHKH